MSINEEKQRAIHTIEYLRAETSALEKYKNTATEDAKLYAAFKRVLAYVEDCNEDYLADCKS